METVPSPFAEPPAFLFQRLVRLVTLTHLRWRLTLGLLRRVCRTWRTGVSGAVEVLAPRPFLFTTGDLLRLPAAFPDLRFLRLPWPSSDGMTNEANAMAVLGRLASLRALQARPGSLAADDRALRWLTRLSWVELGAVGEGCLATLDALGEASNLRHLHVLPSNVSTESAFYELSAAVLATAARVGRLTSLSIPGIDSRTGPALAALVPRLRHLRVGFKEGIFLIPRSLTELLPLSCLSNLQALETEWEVLSDVPGLSCLSGLTRLAVDFSSATYEEVEEGGPASSAVCAALLRRLTGLRSLCLSSGEQEVSWEALQQLSCLATGALTSLDLERMYTVGNEVMRAIGALSKLHTLRLAHTSFDGEGANELARLPQLTALTLVNSGGVYSTAELASAVAQVHGLQRLLLRGHPYLGHEALEQLLCTLPALELLQTNWKPQPGRKEDAALCQRWWHVLQHSLNVVAGDPLDEGWAEFDAAGALEVVGAA